VPWPGTGVNTRQDPSPAACCLTREVPLATLNPQDYGDFKQHHGLRILGTE